ncbi:helix-turn-helix domain-containing protein [Afipia felis]|uniref:Uncharacterized protein n=2 Tax=Afipia felis TaxID=1035 RepID=A0A380W7S4_AFIFE|nr:helix-turn-helix domain-containing protein [Afipia felis]EKS28232.1 hypothetical protein HMPREF9697_00760 [Afipia felis ATCC 53690]SUU76942.1 Uncharacterised protein [Afipia felis]SUU85008.1 Uncharacterised protein [Afipia felis]
MSSDRDPDRKSETRRRLTIVNHAVADHRVASTAFQVLSIIAKHVNGRTGKAYLSDEVILEYLPVEERTVRRARNLLRDLEWIEWTKEGAANVYKLLDKNVPMIAQQIKERKERRLLNRAQQKESDRTSVTKKADENRTNLSSRGEYNRTNLSNEGTFLTSERTLVSKARSPMSTIPISSTNSDTNSTTHEKSNTKSREPDSGDLFPSKSEVRPIKHGRTKGKTDLPENWQFSDEVWAFAAHYGLSGPEIEQEQAKLKDWAKSTGRRYADWDAFARNWIRNDKSRLQRVRGNAQGDAMAGLESYGGRGHG